MAFLNNFSSLSFTLLFLFVSYSSPTQSSSTSDEGFIDLHTNGVIDHVWMEIGYVFVNDREWTQVSTQETTMNPTDAFNMSVFISLTGVTEQDQQSNNQGGIVPFVPKLLGRPHRLASGEYSFFVKLVQPNGSTCSKEWHIPQPSGNMEVSWILVRESVYDLDSKLFIVGSDFITRNNSVRIEKDFPHLSHHVKRFTYPFAVGCNVPTSTPCNFSVFAGDSSSLRLGALQQLQTNNNLRQEGDTLWDDQWLTVRSRDVQNTFADFIIVTHNVNRSLYPDYESIHTREVLSYIIFESDLHFICAEELVLFETHAIEFLLDSGFVAAFSSLEYSYPPGVFGMIGTIANNLTDAVSLHITDRTNEITLYGDVGDQCLTENYQEFTMETAYFLSAGKVAEGFLVAGESANATCFVRFSLPREDIFTSSPTTAPTPLNVQPGEDPSISPVAEPSCQPSAGPTVLPIWPPSAEPSSTSSSQPTSLPSAASSGFPSITPSGDPSAAPSIKLVPTVIPSTMPSVEPSRLPTSEPSCSPSFIPSGQPSVIPSGEPSGQPTIQPSAEPSITPTSWPTRDPTSEPTGIPSMTPSGEPSGSPSVTASPTAAPSTIPSALPSITFRPTNLPSIFPSASPSALPSGRPSNVPSSFPSHHPSCSPTSEPSRPSSGSEAPSVVPTTDPPTIQPVENTNAPSVNPTAAPSAASSAGPSSMPSAQPSPPNISCAFRRPNKTALWRAYCAAN